MKLENDNSLIKLILMRTHTFMKLLAIVSMATFGPMLLQAGQVELYLVDAMTGKDFRPLKNGDIINLEESPATFSIRAEVITDIAIGAVQLTLNDRANSLLKSAPYTFGRQPNGGIPPLLLPQRTNKLQVKAYTTDTNIQVILAEQTIYFTVVPNSAANMPPSVSVSYFTGICSGEDFTLQIDATDIDGDVLEYTMVPGSVLPPSSILDPKTGQIKGRALGDGSSSYEYEGSIRVADDKGLFTVAPFLIEVYHCDMKEIIHSFSLVNTVTGEEVQQFDPFAEPEVTFDLAKIPVATTLRVDYDPSYVGFIGSVKFYYYPPREDRRVLERIINDRPYTLGGSMNGKYLPFQLKLGKSTIGAQIFAGPNGTNRKIGSTVYLSVNVVNSETGEGLEPEQILAKANLLPNPSTGIDQILLEYESLAAGELYIELWNARGITYFRKRAPVQAGPNYLSLETESLIEGTYFLQIRPPQGAPSLVTLKKVDPDPLPGIEPEATSSEEVTELGKGSRR